MAPGGNETASGRNENVTVDTAEVSVRKSVLGQAGFLSMVAGHFLTLQIMDLSTKTTVKNEAMAVKNQSVVIWEGHEGTISKIIAQIISERIPKEARAFC